MRLLTEANKVDAAIEYQALATPAPGIRSRYFKLHEWGKAVFAFVVDTLAAAETVVASVIEAVDNAGTTAAAIATATCTITANTNVSVVTATLATVLVDDTITINGVVFTAAAAADHANLVFDQSGTDTEDATDLAACINAAAGQAALEAAGGAVTATSAAAVVTLTVTEPGETTLTVEASATITIATVQAVGYIEVEDTALSEDFTHAALQLVGPATANATAVIIRGASRYGPADQQVAASDTDS